jgi:hypothetical protein
MRIRHLRRASGQPNVTDKISYGSSVLVDKSLNLVHPRTVPTIGRPRLTPDELQTRVAAYCRTYRVSVATNGLPPFPSGQRETDQHREWMALYKAQARIAGRVRAAAALEEAPLDERHALHVAQDGRCPVCLEDVDVATSVAVARHPAGRCLMHPPCSELTDRLRPLGPEGLDRLRAYLWPPRAKPAR